jgi:hypothetical protein
MQYSLVEIVTFALSLAGVIWKVSQLQSEIKSFVVQKISQIEKDLDIHVTSQIEKEEMTEYLINELKNLIQHKAQRLEESIKDLKSNLEKRGVL